jgi:hypothetical protein
MPRPLGYACISDPESGNREYDTFTCAHCQYVVHLPPNKKIEEVGDFCRSCYAVICANCADKKVCSPILKKIEQMEERRYRLLSYV